MPVARISDRAPNLAVFGYDDEAVPVSACIADLSVFERDRVVHRDLASRPRVELVGRRAVEPEEPTDMRGERLLCPPTSRTKVRRRARPSTSAALSPAAPPPTTTQSYFVRPMNQQYLSAEWEPPAHG